MSKADPAPIPIDGDGPFVSPMMANEISFGHGETVAIMKMRTVAGQEVLVPFDRETLRTLGLALADALQDAFPKDAVVPDDLVFERRDEA